MKDFREINSVEAIGKTVAAIATSESHKLLAIRFEDDTVLSWKAVTDYEGGCEFEENSPRCREIGHLDLCNSWSGSILVGLGLATKGERLAAEAKHEQARAESEKACRRAQYERLRKEFGGGEV